MQKKIWHLFNLCAYCKMLLNVPFTVISFVNCPAWSATLYSTSVCNMREQRLCHIDIFCVVPGVFAHRKQQLVNFNHTIIHLRWLCLMTCFMWFTLWLREPASISWCIMGHMGSKQSLSAYQILSQSGDSSAVCSGCQACCHSNWVGIDGLLLCCSTDESLLGLNPVLTMSPCGHITMWALHSTTWTSITEEIFFPLSNTGCSGFIFYVHQRGYGFSNKCCLIAQYLKNYLTDLNQIWR